MGSQRKLLRFRPCQGLFGLLFAVITIAGGFCPTKAVAQMRSQLPEIRSVDVVRAFPNFAIESSANLSDKAFGQKVLDSNLLRSLNGSASRSVELWLGSTDHAAYPVLLGTPILYWASALTDTGLSAKEAGALSFSWVGAVGSSLVLKRLVKKRRPYSKHDWVQVRDGYPGTKHLSESASMPSGHSAIASALATSIILQHRQIEVVLPASLVAISIGASRVWLGVHYPKDVAMGFALGIISGTVAHQLIF